MRKFTIVKRFTAGPLAGLTYTETTDVAWKAGQEVREPIGGSPYVVVSVVEGK